MISFQKPLPTGHRRRSRSHVPSRRPPSGSSICAKLVTTNNGRKEVIVLGLNKPVMVGRNPELCAYVITDPSVSGQHCKISAARSANGGVIVSCQDLSKNGIVVNGHRIRKACAILMDGDSLHIPDSLTFTCMHLWKEPHDKATVFEQTPPPDPVAKQIGHYIVMSQSIGSGAFATVHIALDVVNKRQVACKSIRTRKEHEIGAVKKEVKILMSLDHPNINRIYASEVTGNFIHIFLQLCTGGDLFSYVTAKDDCRLCESETRYIMFQLFKALKYLHDKSISHRDLKPENILLYGPGPYPRILIADFGLARPKSYQETFNVCGTVSYLPPEGIIALDHRNRSYIGMPSDCWSAGVILYIMLAGSHPFDYDSTFGSSDNWLHHIKDSHDLDSSQYSQSYLSSEERLKERIVYGSADMDKDPWRDLPEAKYLVKRLLEKQYLHRATVRTALGCRWIMADIIELEKAYNERIIALLPPEERPNEFI